MTPKEVFLPVDLVLSLTGSIIYHRGISFMIFNIIRLITTPIVNIVGNVLFILEDGFNPLYSGFLITYAYSKVIVVILINRRRRRIQRILEDSLWPLNDRTKVKIRRLTILVMI